MTDMRTRSAPRQGLARRLVRMCAPGPSRPASAIAEQKRRVASAARRADDAASLSAVRARLGPAAGGDADALERLAAYSAFVDQREASDATALEGVGAVVAEVAALLSRRRSCELRTAAADLLAALLQRLTPRALMRGERVEQNPLLDALLPLLRNVPRADNAPEMRASAAAARALEALVKTFGTVRERAVENGALLSAASLAERSAEAAERGLANALPESARLAQALCSASLSGAALRAGDAALPALARTTRRVSPSLPAGAAALASLLWALSQMSEGPNERIAAVLGCLPRHAVVTRATELLLCADETVAHPALRVIGNIVTGDDAQTQAVVDAGALPLVRDVALQRRSERMRKEALWLISNVCAGTAAQVGFVLAAGTLPVVVDVLLAPESEQPRALKKEAMWCLSNMTSSGDDAALRQVLGGDGVPALLRPLRAQLDAAGDEGLDSQLEAVALEGLDNLFSRMDAVPAAGFDAARAVRAELLGALDGCDGYELLQELARGGGAAALACGKAQRVLRTFFADAPRDGWVVAQDVGVDGFGRFGERDAFTTLEEASAFWARLASPGDDDEEDAGPAAGDNDNDDSAVAPVALEELVPSGSVRGVLLFLSKLRHAREFQKSAALRLGLARRVQEALALLRDDPDSRAEVLARMVDSVDACGDKPVWALNQLSLVAAVAAARGDAERLREVGRGVMRLGIVHEHALKAMASRGAHVDDVCVFLSLEIALRESLALPVSAEMMLFPAYARLTEEEVLAAEQDALAVSEDGLELWLAEWPAWQALQRAGFADALRWKELPELQLSRASLRASLTNLVGDAVEDPVRLLLRPEGKRGTEGSGAAKSAVWSLADLMTHWRASGMDLHNVPRSAEYLRDNLRRCTRRVSVRA